VSRTEYDNIFGTLSKYGTHQGGSPLFQDNEIAINVDLLERIFRKKERLRDTSTDQYEYAQGSTFQDIFASESREGPDGRQHLPHRLLDGRQRLFHRLPYAQNRRSGGYLIMEENNALINAAWHVIYQDKG
jgi:hypothetical protein